MKGMMSKEVFDRRYAPLLKEIGKVLAERERHKYTSKWGILLNLYFLEEISDKDKIVFEKHLKKCSYCQEILEEMVEFRDFLMENFRRENEKQDSNKFIG